MDHSPQALRRGTVLVATLLAAVVATTSALPSVASSSARHAPAAPTSPPATTRGLTNLDHLDWLSVPVTPPAQEGHTTYRLGEEPSVGVLWTYAEPRADGGWRHVGGGTYHSDTDTWGQGAYNADDISRAAVVYLRHWQATGSDSSRHAAYEMLRGLTYLQTTSGPNAGNVVLWMQPDGTLNPSAEPKEQPDPSDSDASYWLARTIWALGEGYAAFETSDPAFAGFLRDRLELAIAAVDRQVLDRYGDHLDIDGQPAPAWLIADGADASAEAVLGLSAYVSAGGSATARSTLARLSEGIAELQGGDARSWPMGAVRNWALSRSMWHGWGGQMPAALARASQALGDRAPSDPSLIDAAASDSFTFDPWLLTSGGPDNGRMPTRGDTSQIAYGADSRLQSLVATADSTGQDAALGLAGIVGAWFFGANPAGEAMYDPATGVTYDGISGSGQVNHNSGAESTIHGLLSMIALDQHPAAEELAMTADVVDRQGTLTLQAEDGTLAGNATATKPESLWTGESLFGGTGYAALGDGGSTTMTLPEHPRSLVLPVVDLRPGSDAVTTFREDEQTLGRVASGDIGEQGDSPAPGALLPVTVPGTLPAGATVLSATTATGAGDPAALDAVMLEPLVSRLVLGGEGHGTALLRSTSTTSERARVQVPGSGTARVATYDGDGQLVDESVSTARTVTVSVPAGGFALVRR
ncbi:hypothetical protein GCM10009844_42080 [Nocardioides koreensis]|uniref:Uncharacterized protein n=1 Tax=Nocardioides koreensis TaxID=433651 RepID=A0ABP5LW93_9ACTN